jgi:hypothetical protein
MARQLDQRPSCGELGPASTRARIGFNSASSRSRPITSWYVEGAPIRVALDHRPVARDQRRVKRDLEPVPSKCVRKITGARWSRTGSLFRTLAP